ncbi:MAG TPA: ComEA family DNA-binding protein [Thermomicrobiales bacterium]|jgi:competence protein ComEA|nr:ComEA family DNA-binding protein [Thermomicrobiales bacterium]
MSRVLVVLVSAAAGLIVVYALMSALDDRAAPEIVIEPAATPAAFVVEIAGAVATPGIYQVDPEARLANVVATAGGFAPQADLTALNLARRISDGDKIVIPSLAAATAPVVAPNAPSGPTTASTGQALDLNAASADELDALPGIGPVLAQRIVDDRTTNGPFATVDELARVQGISPRMVDALRGLVVVR